MDTDEVTAWATVAAVIVALVGPYLFELYRRDHFNPKLSLKVMDGYSVDPLGTSGIWLSVSNAAGRRTAQDVQIFLTGHGESSTYGPEVRWHLGDATLLRFGEGGTTSVPANFHRRVSLGWVTQELRSDDVEDGTTVGRVNTAEDNPAPFMSGFTYEILIAVTGSNFDACFWRAKLIIEERTTSEGKKWFRHTWSKEPASQRHHSLDS